MIINNRLVSIQTKYNVTCNVYVQYLLKENKGCRTFYDQLIQVDQITSQITDDVKLNNDTPLCR